ncbi:hypothetical protein QQ045_002280 [Rhodiola kirilowii]
MATVEEEPKGGTVITDEMYEFSAPRFFDFIAGESDEEMRRAELWFESALSYAPSPCMPKIKVGRDVVVEPMSDFGEALQQPVVSEPAESMKETSEMNPLSQMKTAEGPATTEQNCGTITKAPTEKQTDGGNEINGSTTSIPTASTEGPPVNDADTLLQACTPKSQVTCHRDAKKATSVKNAQSSKKIDAGIQNPSALRTNSLDIEKKHIIAMSNLAQENQAIKRQKLDEGRSRKILNVNPVNLLHKSRPGVVPDNSGLQLSVAALRKQERKDAAAGIAKKHKLTLTRPKEPHLETSQRARPARVKSTAELEEEMMAKIPKFKARPVNKKKTIAIQQKHSIPPYVCSYISEYYCLQEFHLQTMAKANQHTETASVASTESSRQEFHLQTMARANQHTETASVASTESSRQNSQWKPRLTEPKTPQLQTSLRARAHRLSKVHLNLNWRNFKKFPSSRPSH